MRIISRSTLIKYWKKYPEIEQSLKAWYDEVLHATWKSPNELKKQYRNASIISKKRVIFNIKGNPAQSYFYGKRDPENRDTYRLIVDIEYRIGIVFIVWLGTHKEYDKIDVKEVKYVKTD